MKNVYIPADVFDGLTQGLAKRLNDGLMPHISGHIEPHQIAEILADSCLLPADVMRQVIIDQNAEAYRQAESMVPAVARPA
ncbi:hypothetical protein DFR48_102283 [Ciceribacter lividus]|uniref:Uncharacterized protein n=1 Tax=Ciceribacter lividus TaxID=1197950 RepID=A0A6I7HR87_9HYPH|nr:hypothetical protein [Ciceribacter lividus]RCW27797.1 hypothetical protein DFR48_102283 [Ciceribacter lividus]